MSKRMWVILLALPLLGLPSVLAEARDRTKARPPCTIHRELAPRPCKPRLDPSPSPSTTTTPPTVPLAPGSRLVGISTSAAPGGSRLDKVVELEGDFGGEVGVFRLYEDIESGTLTSDDVALAQLAGAAAISMDVPASSTWASIPRGDWDTALSRWATDLKSLAGSGVSLFLIALTHEPENAPTNRGTAAQYVAASRYFVSFMRAEGVPARFVFAPMLFKFATKMSRWYPGNGYIDVIAPDGYNWNGPESCDGSKTFSRMFQTVVDAARARGKQWGVSEFGTTHRSTDATHQARWLDAAHAFADANGGNLAYLIYWYNDARCDWTFHRTEAFAAFGRML